MTGIEAYAFGVTVLLLLVLSAYCFARSGAAFAKAEVYREFADTFHGLSQATWWKKGAERQAERHRQWMRLCLCDPLVCDALRAALDDADKYWKRAA